MPFGPPTCRGRCAIQSSNLQGALCCSVLQPAGGAVLFGPPACRGRCDIGSSSLQGALCHSVLQPAGGAVPFGPPACRGRCAVRSSSPQGALCRSVPQPAGGAVNFGPPARRGRCAVQSSMPQGGTALLSSLFSSSLQVSVVDAELCGNKGVDLVPRCSLVLINGRGRGWGGAALIQDGRPW